MDKKISELNTSTLNTLDYVPIERNNINYKINLSAAITDLRGTSGTAPTISSGSTITPLTSIVFISDENTIQTITPPEPIASSGGQITLIPIDLSGFSTGTSGNIALASLAVLNKALIMTYDSYTGKWYPSYQ